MAVACRAKEAFYSREARARSWPASMTKASHHSGSEDEGGEVACQGVPRIHTSHEMEWVSACKQGRAADADFSYSGPLTEICLLGNIAKRVDSRIVGTRESQDHELAGSEQVRPQRVSQRLVAVARRGRG